MFGSCRYLSLDRQPEPRGLGGSLAAGLDRELAQDRRHVMIDGLPDTMRRSAISALPEPSASRSRTSSSRRVRLAGFARVAAR